MTFRSLFDHRTNHTHTVFYSASMNVTLKSFEENAIDVKVDDQVRMLENPAWYASAHTIMLVLLLVVVGIFGIRTFLKRCRENKADYQTHVNK